MIGLQTKIEVLAKRLFVMDYEDAKQFLYTAALDALPRYEDRGHTPSAFMETVLNNVIVSELRKPQYRSVVEAQERKVRGNQHQAAEDTLITLVPTRFDYQHDEHLVFELTEDVQAVISKLSPYQQQICHGLLSGKTKTAIQAEMNACTHTFWKELDEIRDMFAKEGLYEYL